MPRMNPGRCRPHLLELYELSPGGPEDSCRAEPGLLVGMQKILADCGYRMLAAGAPAEALHISARGKNIDLLLFDVIMPVKNGRTLEKDPLRILPNLKYSSPDTRKVSSITPERSTKGWIQNKSPLIGEIFFAKGFDSFLFWREYSICFR